MMPQARRSQILTYKETSRLFLIVLVYGDILRFSEVLKKELVPG